MRREETVEKETHILPYLKGKRSWVEVDHISGYAMRHGGRENLVADQWVLKVWSESEGCDTNAEKSGSYGRYRIQV